MGGNMTSRFRMIANYLENVQPSKSYEEYEKHKNNLKKIISDESCMWLEVLKELTERMFI